MVMSELTAVIGSRVSNDFGVQGEQASCIVFKWISSFLKRNNTSMSVSLEGFLACRALLIVIHAVCTAGCHAMLKAFQQTSNLWPSSHLSSQSTWTAGKSCCTSISFHHRTALLLCGLWLRKDYMFSAQQTYHCKRLDTLMGSSELTHVTKVH